MTDEELEKALRQLGMDSTSYRALALLPLVQVAWADGTIQDAERDLILKLAEGRYQLAVEGARVLRNWLHHPPSASYAKRGRELLLELTGRSGYAVTPADLGDVVQLAKQVARAAGGFFGFGAIEATEAQAIDEIAQALRIGAEQPWVHPGDITMIPEDADRESDGPPVQVVVHPGPEPRHPVGSLVMYDPDRGDRTCPVDQAGISIGRGPSNRIQIEYDAQVSRTHCRVHAERDRAYVEDLRSVSGTWVDGERVVERRLFGGEELRVGSVVLFYVVR